MNTKFSAVLIAGLLLTQGALANTEALSTTALAAAPQNVQTIVVTGQKTGIQPRLTTAETATALLQRLRAEAVEELQQQLDVGSLLPELMQTVTRTVLNPALVVQAGR